MAFQSKYAGFKTTSVKGKLYAQTVPAKMSKKEIVLSILEILTRQGKPEMDDDSIKTLMRRSQTKLRDDLMDLYDFSKWKSVKDVWVIDSRKNRSPDEKDKGILFLPISASSKKETVFAKKKTEKIKIKKPKQQPPPPPSSSSSSSSSSEEEKKVKVKIKKPPKTPLASSAELEQPILETGDITEAFVEPIDTSPEFKPPKFKRQKSPRKPRRKKKQVEIVEEKKDPYAENPILQMDIEDAEVNPFVGSTGNFDIYNEVLNPISFPEPELTFQHKLSKLQTLQRKVILPEEDVENYEIAVALEKKRGEKKRNDLKQKVIKPVMTRRKKRQVKKKSVKKVMPSLIEYRKLLTAAKKKKKKECDALNKKLSSI